MMALTWALITADRRQLRRRHSPQGGLVRTVGSSRRVAAALPAAAALCPASAPRHRRFRGHLGPVGRHHHRRATPPPRQQIRLGGNRDQ
jgi:hypothetical protein